MKNYCYLFLFILIAQKGISQPWVPLGTNEQTSNSIVATAAFTFFTAVSPAGVPYVSYIDDATGPHNLGDYNAHAQRFNNGQWELAGDAITPLSPSSDYFPVAFDGDTLYAAYAEALVPANIQRRLTVKKLNTSTNQWEIVGRRGFSDSAVDETAITAANGKIYVAYLDAAADNKITVKYYDNAHPDNDWQTVGAAGLSNGSSAGINLVIDNGIPYIAYFDFTNGGVFVKKFNGAAWENVGTNDPDGVKFIASCSLKFNSRHVPYIAFVDANAVATVSKLNNLNAWERVGGPLAASPLFTNISLAILKDSLFASFGVHDDAGITQVAVKKYNSGSNTWTNAGNQPVTSSTSSSSGVALATDGISKLFVFYLNFTEGGLFAKTLDAGSLLPVTLTDFNATKVKDATLLQWTTAGKLNNKLFEIEYSSDAKTFTKIGEVAANSNTNIQQHYSFIHSSPAAGINYYRLKQVDKNGNYSYSKTISLVFSPQQPLLTVFPNPVQNVLHISYIPAGVKEIVIYNADGKAVKNIQSNERLIDINVTGLSAGAYFISFYGDAISETSRFIK